MQILELKIPPVAVALTSAALQYGIHERWTLAAFSMNHSRLWGTLFMLVGLMVAGVGVVSFRMASTTMDPLDPGRASSLVTGSIYRFTRNPMYLGIALVLTGWGVMLANMASISIVIPFSLYMTMFQIIPEERGLQELFGESFAAYRANTRRWL